MKCAAGSSRNTFLNRRQVLQCLVLQQHEKKLWDTVSAWPPRDLCPPHAEVMEVPRERTRCRLPPEIVRFS